MFRHNAAEHQLASIVQKSVRDDRRAADPDADLDRAPAMTVRSHESCSARG